MHRQLTSPRINSRSESWVCSTGVRSRASGCARRVSHSARNPEVVAIETLSFKYLRSSWLYDTGFHTATRRNAPLPAPLTHPGRLYRQYPAPSTSLSIFVMRARRWCVSSIPEFNAAVCGLQRMSWIGFHICRTGMNTLIAVSCE